MKRLLLLFALECYALTLPSIKNPAVWNVEEGWEVAPVGAKRTLPLLALRYSEPFDGFRNGKIDFMWSDKRFLAAAGFGSASFDSIFKELEFSGMLGFKPFDFLSLKLGETANISWIPGDGSWQEHKVSAMATFFYKDWAKISISSVNLSWLFSCEASFSELYSLGLEMPTRRLFQKITLGYFSIYNSFAYPGPVLGFGITLSVLRFSAGAGHLRAGYPSGHTGFLLFKEFGNL
jgi:hypothetical protein